MYIASTHKDTHYIKAYTIMMAFNLPQQCFTAECSLMQASPSPVPWMRRKFTDERFPTRLSTDEFCIGAQTFKMHTFYVVIMKTIKHLYNHT